MGTVKFAVCDVEIAAEKDHSRDTLVYGVRGAVDCVECNLLLKQLEQLLESAERDRAALVAMLEIMLVYWSTVDIAQHTASNPVVLQMAKLIVTYRELLPATHHARIARVEQAMSKEDPQWLKT